MLNLKQRKNLQEYRLFRSNFILMDVAGIDSGEMIMNQAILIVLFWWNGTMHMLNQYMKLKYVIYIRRIGYAGKSIVIYMEPMNNYSDIFLGGEE